MKTHVKISDFSAPSALCNEVAPLPITPKGGLKTLNPEPYGGSGFSMEDLNPEPYPQNPP